MGYLLSITYNFFLVLLAGISLHVMVSLSGKFFLAFPVIYTVSRYTLAITEKAGCNPWLAFFFGTISALLTGILFALLERRLSKDSFAVLGLAAVFASLALVKSWASLTNGVLGISGISRPHGFESLFGVVLIAGGLALFAFLLEFVLLKTSLNKKWRGMKEAPQLMQSMGFSIEKLSFWTLTLGSLFIGLAGMPYVWFTQYLDPSTGGILVLLEGLSVAILARQPKVSAVFFSALFVSLLPEVIRFLNLPSSVFGPIRSMIYSVLMVILLYVLQKKSLNPNRQI